MMRNDIVHHWFAMVLHQWTILRYCKRSFHLQTRINQKELVVSYKHWIGRKRGKNKGSNPLGQIIPKYLLCGQTPSGLFTFEKKDDFLCKIKSPKIKTYTEKWDKCSLWYGVGVSPVCVWEIWSSLKLWIGERSSAFYVYWLGKGQEIL